MEAKVIDRVRETLKPATATMIVEHGEDRHFVVEAVLTTVALYLLGKYCDGFVEGLGIKDLGKADAHRLEEIVDSAARALSGKKGLEPKELEAHDAAVTQLLASIEGQPQHQEALQHAERSLADVLVEHGVPQGVAEIEAARIAQSIWRR